MNDKPKLDYNVINKPVHYTYGEIEVIDFIEQITKYYPTTLGFSIGNVIKYLARAPFKGDVLENLKKAKWYLDRAIEKESK